MACRCKCKKQVQQPICQSCAMPMQQPEDFGTNVGGGKNEDYCAYCYQQGAFVDACMTAERMIEECAAFMKEKKLPDSHVKDMMNKISQLKRWNQ